MLAIICNGLKAILMAAEKFKGAYFFTPPQTAAGRRNYEEYNSVSEIRFFYNGEEITAAYDVECSCKNVYAKGNYAVNGKKTTLTKIKDIFKWVDAIYSELCYIGYIVSDAGDVVGIADDLNESEMFNHKIVYAHGLNADGELVKPELTCFYDESCTVHIVTHGK